MHKNSHKTQAQLETGKIAPRGCDPASAILCPTTDLPALSVDAAEDGWLQGKLLSVHRGAVPLSFIMSALFLTTAGPLVTAAERLKLLTEFKKAKAARKLELKAGAGRKRISAVLEPDYRVRLLTVKHYDSDARYSVMQEGGTWLDHLDLDVLIKLINLARTSTNPAAGQRLTLEFSLKGLLRSINRKGTGGSGTMWLRQVLHRLWLARVVIKTPNGTISMGLIETVLDLADGDTFGVVLNTRAAALFANGDWAGIDYAERFALRTQLAKYYLISNERQLGSCGELGRP
jgi:hypothetical protein